MEISRNIMGTNYELIVSGRIDGAGANQLELETLAAMRAAPSTLYVTLSQATFLCSAGLRVLLQAWRQMKNGGKAFFIANPSPEVDTVLTMTGFRDQMVEGARPQ